MVAFGDLSRMHGFKISPTFPCSVEDCGLAVGELIGHSSIKSAARMNGAVVMFVDSVAKANKVVETGIVVNDSFVSVSPLTTPAARVTISNIPPFIGDELLVKELSRHGKVVSAIRKLPSGFKSPLMRHVVGYRRQVHMILNKKDEELNLVFSIKVNDFSYAVFVNSGTLKCFGCGGEGHLARACPEKTPAKRAEPAEATAGTSADVETVKQRVAGVENHIQCVANIEGERLDVEDAKQCGESPMKASKSVENDKQCGKNPEDAILGVKNGRQSECIVQKEGDNAVKEPAETVEAGPIPAAAEGCSDSEEGLMEEEDTACKPPLLKRKQGSETCGSKAKKTAASGEQGEQTQSVSSEEEQVESESREEEEQAEAESSEEEEMEDGGTGSQPLTDSTLLSASQLEELYTVQSIQMFLQKTKNMKNVKFEEYFADKNMLLLSVKAQMSIRGEGGFSELEVYRLRKIALRLKQELHAEGYV